MIEKNQINNFDDKNRKKDSYQNRKSNTIAEENI